MVSRILEYVRGIAEIRNFNLFGKNITNVDAAIDDFTTYSTHMERLKRFPLYRIALLSELYISKTYHKPLKSRLIYPKNYVKL